MREQAGVAVIVMAGGVQRLLVDRRGDDAGGLARPAPSSTAVRMYWKTASPQRGLSTPKRSGRPVTGTSISAQRPALRRAPTSGRSTPLAAMRAVEDGAVADDGEVARARPERGRPAP